MSATAPHAVPLPEQSRILTVCLVFTTAGVLMAARRTSLALAGVEAALPDPCGMKAAERVDHEPDARRRCAERPVSGTVTAVLVIHASRSARLLLVTSTGFRHGTT